MHTTTGNPHAYWFYAAALISVDCARVIAATGTPYNNREQDIATLQAMIDPTSNAATIDFWDNAVGKRGGGLNSDVIADNIRKWREFDNGDAKGMLRRSKDVLQVQLPKKTIREEVVEPSGPHELNRYIVIVA
jgi:hypothetical protein